MNRDTDDGISSVAIRLGWIIIFPLIMTIRETS